MDTGTLITIFIVALVVVVLLFLMRAAGVGRPRPRLVALPFESRERYINDWDAIENKFVDAPEQSVREAESLVMSLLRERGHPLTERDLPMEVQRAHKLGYSSKDRTEGMRQALLHYRAVMVKMIGPEPAAPQQPQPEQKPESEKRREMA